MTQLPVFFNSPTRSNRWEKSLTLAASTASFLALAVSIKIWQDTDKRQINLATLSLFEKFRDDRFHDIRHRAWKVKNKWDNQKGYKEKFEKAAFPEDMLSKNEAV
ncbi:hypothetical protein [Spirosoma litoris]